MAMEFFTKEFFIGAGTALSSGIAGFMAFSRFWISNKANNANDSQRIDMLERQDKALDRSEEENKYLRGLISQKDEQIRAYFEDLTYANARLQTIEESLRLLKEQNDSLAEKVKDLTKSNQDLTSEITHLRATLGGTL